MSAYTFTDMLAERTQLFVNCADPCFGHSAEADVQALADKFGADHGAMHDDLVGLLRCRRCKDAGRARYAVCFALVRDYGSMDRSRGCVAGEVREVMVKSDPLPLLHRRRVVPVAAAARVRQFTSSWRLNGPRR